MVSPTKQGVAEVYPPGRARGRRPYRSEMRSIDLLTKPTAAWGLNLKHITDLHLHLTNMRHHLHTAVRTDHGVDTRRARRTTCGTKGRMNATIRKNGRCHRFKKADAPNTPITTTPATCATRPVTNLLALQPHGEAKLQHLRIGQA